MSEGTNESGEHCEVIWIDDIDDAWVGYEDGYIDET